MKEIFRECQQKISKLQQSAKNYPQDRWEAIIIVSSYCEFLEEVFSLGNNLHTWLESAKAGEKIKQKYQQLLQRLESEKTAFQLLQKEYKDLAEKEEELKKLVEEHGRLKEELERLKKLESLVASLNIEDLRQQVKTLKERRDILEAGDLLAQLQEDGKALLVLGKEAISKLEPEIQDVLNKAEEVIKKTEEKAQQLAQLRKRYQEAKQEWEKLNFELNALIEADEKVARALPDKEDGVSNVLEGIEEVKKLIQAIEEALSLAIFVNEKNQRREHTYLG